MTEEERNSPQSDGDSYDIIKVRIEPDQAARIWEESRNGSVVIPVQLTNNHHYYPSSRPRSTAEELVSLHENVGIEFAERVLSMMENEQAAVIAYEQRSLDADIEYDKKAQSLQRQGLWGGIALATLFSIFGVVALYLGHPFVAGVIFGTTILGMLTIVVLGRKHEKPEEEEE